MAYISELISVTLFPVWVDIGSNLSILPISYETRNYDIFVNLNPFSYHFDHASVYTIVKNVCGNLFMMLPYTILLAFNFSKMRKWYMAIGTALLTSVGIEILQLIWQLTMLSSTRKTDITDVIQNVVGAAIGFVLYRFILSKVPIFKPFIVERENDKNMKSDLKATINW